MQDIISEVFEWYADNKSKCDSLYDMAEDEKFDEIYENIKEKDRIERFFIKSGIVIVTANKYERNILHKKVFECTNKRICRFNIKISTAMDTFSNLYAYSYEINGHSILHIHTRVTGSYTAGGIADVVRYILGNRLLFPTVIISFGICFGINNKKQDLGDVIISEKIYPYFIGAKIDGEELRVRDDYAMRINDTLGMKIDNIKNGNKFAHFDFSVLFGNYITGEAVVSSRKYRNMFIKTTTQEILAGDMEAYGLFKECLSFPFRLPCITVKSISDWGIDKSFDNIDTKILNRYNKIVNKKEDGLLNNIEIRLLMREIKSVKDRIQAFASGNAWDTIVVLLNEDVFDISLYRYILKKINDWRGVSITQKSLMEQLNKYANKFGYVMNDTFFKSCINAMIEDGVVKDFDNDVVTINIKQSRRRI